MLPRRAWTVAEIRHSPPGRGSRSARRRWLPAGSAASSPFRRSRPGCPRWRSLHLELVRGLRVLLRVLDRPDRWLFARALTLSPPQHRSVVPGPEFRGRHAILAHAPCLASEFFTILTVIFLSRSVLDGTSKSVAESTFDRLDERRSSFTPLRAARIAFEFEVFDFLAHGPVSVARPASAGRECSRCLHREADARTTSSRTGRSRWM